MRRAAAMRVVAAAAAAAACLAVAAAQETVTLQMNVPVTRTYSSSGTMFTVTVPSGANDPKAHMEADNWLDDDLKMFVYTTQPAFIPPSDPATGSTCATYAADDDNTFEAYYNCALSEGQNWIWVDESGSNFGSTYTMEAQSSSLSGGAIAAIVIVLLLVFGAACTWQCARTHRKSGETEDSIVENDYTLCAILSLSMMIAPIVLLIVGLTSSMAIMRGVMGGVGGGLLFCFSLWLGHTTIVLDGKAQEVQIIKRYCFAFPRTKRIPFNDIRCFDLTSTLSSKNGVLYQRGIQMTDGGREALDTGNSNINVGGRRASVAKFNRFLQKYKAPGTVPENVETGIGALMGMGAAGMLGGGGAATAAMQQQQLMMQQQLLMQQQQLAAMQARGAGAGPAGATVNPAFAMGGGAPMGAAPYMASGGGGAGMPYASPMMPPGAGYGGGAPGGAGGSFPLPMATAPMPPGYGGSEPPGTNDNDPPKYTGL